MTALDASAAKLLDMMARLDDGSEPVVVQLVSTLIAANDTVLAGAELVREQRAEVDYLRAEVERLRADNAELVGAALVNGEQLAEMSALVDARAEIQRLRKGATADADH